MTASADWARPPSLLLMLIEGRAFYELGAFYWTYPLLRMSERGDGHPVVVLPGLAVGDVSTLALRFFLNDRGYAAHGWELGRNWGRNVHPVRGVDNQLLSQIQALHQRYGRKVSLIGWSMGGLYAREIARVAPDSVRMVITLGAPFTNNPKANNTWRLFELASGERIDRWDPTVLIKSREPLPVPTTSIYSRSDGIVAWQCSVETEGPLRENIEVEGSHIGLGHNPLVLYAIADRLAQPEGEWRPFQRSGLRHYLYPDPRRDRL